jgi:hypothetical protein
MFMQKWGSRQDELAVLYRTNPGLPWITLQNFTQSVSSWTEQIIDLPAGITDVQIGFRGTAKWALGVCIDDIEISGNPIVTLNVAPAIHSVPMQSGEVTFAVACPVDWTTLCDAPSWCTITPSGIGNNSITATYTENTIYSKRTANITVTASGGLSQTVTIVQNASNLSVDDLSSAGIRVYPNPAAGFCKILDEQGKNQINEITFTDFTGRVILSRAGHGEKEFGFDLSSLARGTYVVKIKGESVTVNYKLVIIR